MRDSGYPRGVTDFSDVTLLRKFARANVYDHHNDKRPRSDSTKSTITTYRRSPLTTTGRRTVRCGSGVKEDDIGNGNGGLETGQVSSFRYIFFDIFFTPLIFIYKLATCGTVATSTPCQHHSGPIRTKRAYQPTQQRPFTPLTISS
jgi:hypothetical protein